MINSSLGVLSVKRIIKKTLINMEDIVEVDYRHPKRVYKEFDNKKFGDYHDLYVQSDTLILADVFENFRNKYIETYELDPAHFLSAPGLNMESMF